MSPATLRLAACMEAFAHEQEGAVARDDWPALAALLERELAVATRLAEEAGSAPGPALETRARALRQRFETLQDRISAAREAAARELADLAVAGRRLRSVRGAYGAAPRAEPAQTAVG